MSLNHLAQPPGIPILSPVIYIHVGDPYIHSSDFLIYLYMTDIAHLSVKLTLRYEPKRLKRKVLALLLSNKYLA